ncbi:DUF6252 family protein [Flavobacterium sp.]|uniref:DUF6252 family protein n=1 Tax=Flavobacterium sp. TaxID=239 RepID=UPI0038FBF295
MKKLFFCFLLLFTLFSCQDDVKFNNPSIQGIKDNAFWRAINYDATLSNTGVLKINAYTRNEILTLKTSSKNLNTYVLGMNTSNTASYKITIKNVDTVFSTGSDFGDGEIVIEDYDNVNKTVTGSFRFNVSNIDNNPLYNSFVNFQQGVFYKVPVN